MHIYTYVSILCIFVSICNSCINSPVILMATLAVNSFLQLDFSRWFIRENLEDKFFFYLNLKLQDKFDQMKWSINLSKPYFNLCFCYWIEVIRANINGSTSGWLFELSKHIDVLLFKNYQIASECDDNFAISRQQWEAVDACRIMLASCVRQSKSEGLLEEQSKQRKKPTRREKKSENKIDSKRCMKAKRDRCRYFLPTDRIEDGVGRYKGTS